MHPRPVPEQSLCYGNNTVADGGEIPLLDIGRLRTFTQPYLIPGTQGSVDATTTPLRDDIDAAIGLGTFALELERDMTAPTQNSAASLSDFKGRFSGRRHHRS